MVKLYYTNYIYVLYIYICVCIYKVYMRIILFNNQIFFNIIRNHIMCLYSNF